MRIRPWMVVALCAVVDATLLLLPVALFADVAWILRNNSRLVVHLLLPMLVAVVWRGAADAKRGLEGETGWTRPALEGGVLGFLAIPLSDGFNSVPPHDSSPLNWSQYLAADLPPALICGAVGTVVGLCLSAMNRKILRLLPS